MSRRGVCGGAAAFATALALAASAAAQEMVVQATNDDVNMPVMVEKFNRLHPGVPVKLRGVSFQSVLESLPVQLASGQGPDISMVTDWGALSRYYLDIRSRVDAAYFEREFGHVLRQLRGESQPANAVNGVSGTITLNGAFVNLSLFRQAGVPLPGPGATWDDWAQASRKVARATRTEMAMEMDRSGQRFASLAISYGARLVDEQGRPVADAGLKAAIEKFVAWHRDGTMPMDLWGAVGGATHRDNFADFINGKVVFYFGGSWLLKRMDSAVGDLFEWAVVDAPCGPASCTVMPGGGAMVAFKHTKYPERAAEFLAFLAREDNMREGVGRGIGIPVAASLVAKGVSYPGVSDNVQRALASYIRQVPAIPQAAFDFQGWRYQRAAMNSMTTRISQVLTRELTVDTAVAYIKKDVELAIASAKR